MSQCDLSLFIRLNKIFLVLQIFGNVESKKKYIVDTFDGQCIPPKWLIQNDRNSFEPNGPFGRPDPSGQPSVNN